MPRDVQAAAPRSTEGPRAGQPAPGSRLRQSKGGRPKGSKNKPKSLVPAEVADQLLITLKDALPPEQYEYLRGVVKGGQVVSTIRELDILLTVLNRSLLPHLLLEMGGGHLDRCEEGCQIVHPAYLTKEVSERIRVVQSLLSLRNQIEKREEKPKDDDTELVFGIFAKRGLDPARLARLVGPPGGVSGSPDGTGRGTDSSGAVSDQVSERPILLPAGEQVEADRL